MKRLKIKIFIRRHRWLFTLAIIIILFGGFTLLLRNVDISSITSDPTIFGALGTLVGAFIGGFFTLAGSIWAIRREQKAKQNVRRKNIIYSPLYDELTDIQDRILPQNPYPLFVTFETGPQTICPHPQFAAWGRIKADTRYLEVPRMLAEQLDAVEGAIEDYLANRANASKETMRILNEVLAEYGLSQCSIVNIGDRISGDILSGKETDIYKSAMSFQNDDAPDDVTRARINKEIFERCDRSPAIITVRACYQKWLEAQSKTLEMLSLLIRDVLLRYEG